MRFCLHSDIFTGIPETLLFPLSARFNFNYFDLTDNFLIQLIQKHGKEFGVTAFDGFSDINSCNYQIISIFNAVQSGLTNKFGQELEENSNAYVNSVFSKPQYFLTNIQKFEREELYSKLFQLNLLLSKLECDYLVIDIPGMNILTKEINLNQLYHQKFLAKLFNRIQSIAKMASEEDVTILIRFDHSELIKNNQNYFPFEDFSKSREFYESLIEENENIGLFLDTSVFFTTEIGSMAGKLALIQDLDLNVGGEGTLEEYLLKHPKIGRDVFSILKNIEFIKIVALNDIPFLDSFQVLYDKFLKSKKYDPRIIESVKMELSNHLKKKKLMGFGNLPLKSFLINLKNLNMASKYRPSFSMNSQLQVEEFTLNSIDFRDINANKINFKLSEKKEIEFHIQEKMTLKITNFNQKRRKSNKQDKIRESEYNLDVRELENPLFPGSQEIKDLKVFSLIEIEKSARKFHEFL